ncbi:MAG: hypothetical protein AAGF47_11760, partial [Planctomycetota bacterium]
MRARHGILLCALALLTIGVVMVNSAGMRIMPASAEAPIADTRGLSIAAILGGRDGIFAGLALAAFAAAGFLPRGRVARLRAPRPAIAGRVLLAGVLG